MSIQAVAWALDQDLPARPKLVLVSIANHANHTDGYCWLKADTIAQEASCSPRAVFNFVGALIRNGFVRKAPRRGDDGKRRANDYWILFNREPAEWIKDTDRLLADDGDPEECDAQDVVEPDARHACGDETVPDAPAPVDKPACAVGPHAPACSHIDSEEPSKTKPEEDARARARTPRHYQPPPEPRPLPLGEVTGRRAEQIFVFKPSKAYDAWAVHMSARNRLGLHPNGQPRWNLETTKLIDGQSRRGWYFPSLFPPGDAKPGTDPPGVNPAA
jgi:hypothetical protein